MTDSKFKLHTKFLDWTYSTEELAAIREVLPSEIDDELFASLIKGLCLSINIPSVTLRQAISDYPRRDAELSAELKTLETALLLLDRRINSDGDSDEVAERAYIALFLLCEDISRERSRLAQIHAERRKFSPPDNRSSEFQKKILQAADYIWVKQFNKEPDDCKAYLSFLEAVAKPVLMCKRFRQYGASWSETMAATHVGRLRSREERLKGLDLWDAGL